MSGIDRTSGHIGMSSSTQFKNTASQVGGAAFNVALTGAAGAAGAFGGAGASGAVAAAGSALRSGASAAAGGIGGVTNQVNASAAQTESMVGQVAGAGDDKSMQLLQLQQAMNAQSQMFNTLTNVQKSKHDAAMAAIQNTR